MNLDIGAVRPVDGDQVFLVGLCHSSAEPPFVLLHDATKARRAKRNLRKRSPADVVAALGTDDFVRVDAPHWGTVWFRASRVREVCVLPERYMATSSVKHGSFVLFTHDPQPPDRHAGFLLYGMAVEQVSMLLLER